MTIQLYDLAGGDPSVRFSPYCWRSKLALQHKGLDFEAKPVCFTDKDQIEFSGQKLVPVLVDNGRTVTDSWAMALYLDATYPDAPTLLGDGLSQAHAQAIRAWVDSALHPAMIRIVMLDIFNVIDAKDRDYFRSSREQRFGMTLEEFSQGEAGIPALRQALQPGRLVLRQQPFFGGQAPSFADHMVMGCLLWGRAVSSHAFIADDDEIIGGWLERIVERYGEGARV